MTTTVTQRVIQTLLLAALAPAALAQADLQSRAEVDRDLLSIQRIFVDTLTGGDTAAQMRDLIIGSLHEARLFVITENPDRADAFLRGAAEDLIYTDQFTSSDGVDLRAAGANSSPGAQRGTNRRSFSIGLGDDESVNLRERKHEALATVRLVNQDGDVIWSTTQESDGAKFRGASADVADRIARQLTADYERLRELARRNGSSPSVNNAQQGSTSTPDGAPIEAPIPKP